MKLRASLLAIAFVVATASFTRYEAPDKNHGWISLFNGKDLDGWTNFENFPPKLLVRALSSPVTDLRRAGQT